MWLLCCLSKTDLGSLCASPLLPVAVTAHSPCRLCVGSSAAHTQNNVYYSPLTLFLSVTLVHLCVSHMHTHHVRLSYCYLFLCTVLLFDTDKWKVQVSGVEQCNDSTKQCHQAKLWPSVFYLCSINVTLLLHTLTYSHYTHHSHVHT